MTDVKLCAAGKKVEVKRQYTDVSELLRQTSNQNIKKGTYKYTPCDCGDFEFNFKTAFNMHCFTYS
jgi:hypothetical protein